MVVKLVVNSSYKNINSIYINYLAGKKKPTEEEPWAEETVRVEMGLQGSGQDLLLL